MTYLVRLCISLLALLLAPHSAIADASDTPYAKGQPVLGKVETECNDSFLLDGINKLCKLFEGSECAPTTSTCRKYERQVFAGTNFTPEPGGMWNGMGGSGERIADSIMCAMRELSPQKRGPIRQDVAIDIKLGTFRVTQEVGFKDFRRTNPQFNGYRKLTIDMPVVGKADSITQNISIRRLKYSSQGDPKTSGDSFVINVGSQSKEKLISISPLSFPVTTPIGTFTATPKFDYQTRAPVIAAPYNVSYTDVPNFLGGSRKVRYKDIFGYNEGLSQSRKTITVANFDQHRTGWISQLGLGTRAALPDMGIWSAPNSTIVIRPDLELDKARNSAEANPSVYVAAGAEIKYPDDPRDLLPGWVYSIPFPIDVVAYITITPTVEAGVGGQFNIAASEGSDHERIKEFDVLSKRFAASGLSSGLNAAASFNVKVGFRLFVEAKFPWPIGDKKLVNINKKFPIPITGDKKSAPALIAGGWSTGRETPETLDYLKTFYTELKGPLETSAFLNECYAAQQPEPETPPETPPQKGNPEDLFQETLWPCNVCLSTDRIYHDGRNDPNWNNAIYDQEAKSDLLMPASTPPTTWKCNMSRKSGCYEMCTFNPNTKKLTPVRTPDQIASGLPADDPDRAFLQSCKSDFTGQISSPQQPD